MTDQPSSQILPTAQPPLPVFYQRPELLSLDRHARKSLAASQDHRFAKEANAVPLNGVAPSDATVRSLSYPEAFPVTYVVTRKVRGRTAVDRAAVAVQRRAMRAFLNSPGLKETLTKRGFLTG